MYPIVLHGLHAVKLIINIVSTFHTYLGTVCMTV